MTPLQLMQIPAELRDHPIFNGQTFGVVTAERGEHPPEVNQQRNVQLRQRLIDSGLPHEQAASYFQGTQENPYLVYGPTLGQMMQLGKENNQDSIIFGQGDDHYLVNLAENTYHKAKPKVDFLPQGKDPLAHGWDVYTTVPGRGHFKYDFDWDRPRPVEEIQEKHQPQRGMHKSDGVVYNWTAMPPKMAKSVDELTRKFANLQKKELSKAKDELCKACGNMHKAQECKKTTLIKKKAEMDKAEAPRCKSCGKEFQNPVDAMLSSKHGVCGPCTDAALDRFIHKEKAAWRAGKAKGDVKKAEGEPVQRSHKKYACQDCGTEDVFATNHTGDVSGYCKGCSWRPSFGNTGHKIPALGAQTYRVFSYKGEAHQDTPSGVKKAEWPSKLDDPAWESRAAVFRGPHTGQDISRGLKDPEPHVRVAAARSHRATPDHLMTALLDSHPYVKQAALAHPNIGQLKRMGKTEMIKKAEDSAEDFKDYADCPGCGHPGFELGVLGNRQHFRCRACGVDFSHKVEKEAPKKGAKETKKGEDFIDVKNANDSEKRSVYVGPKGATLPDKIKKTPGNWDEGSGGQTKRGSMSKNDAIPTAPKAPKAPAVAGPAKVAGGGISKPKGMPAMAKWEYNIKKEEKKGSGKIGVTDLTSESTPEQKEKFKGRFKDVVPNTPNIRDAAARATLGSIKAKAGSDLKNSEKMEKAAFAGAAIPPPIPGKAKIKLPGMTAVGKISGFQSVASNPLASPGNVGTMKDVSGKESTFTSLAAKPKIPKVPPMGAGSPNPADSKKKA